MPKLPVHGQQKLLGDNESFSLWKANQRLAKLEAAALLAHFSWAAPAIFPAQAAANAWGEGCE